MRLAELQQVIRAADPAAVLVSHRVLDRLIQRQHQLSSLFEDVPHRDSYIVDRAVLSRHVEQDELDLEPDRLLPATVILLARPSQNTLATLDREALLLRYWRRLFHATVHLTLEKQVTDGRLSPAAVHERIEHIGASEFAEIRMVLGQEKYLLPPPVPPPGLPDSALTRTAADSPRISWTDLALRDAIRREALTQQASGGRQPPDALIQQPPDTFINQGADAPRSPLNQGASAPRSPLPPLTAPRGDDLAVYIEFAAVYLELRCFASNLLPIYFPGLSDHNRIEQLLARDLDAATLFARTRLAGAPEPVVRTDTSSDESHDYYWKLAGSADKAEQAGNTVRAAILRTRATRVAPASLAEATRLKADADLQRLTARLQAALELSDAEADEWLQDLPALLDKADQGTWPVEAAMLYDLQKVGVDHERDIYALDLVEWVTSWGKRPIKRPLPSQRLVRITKHLRSAAQRLTMARLSDEERQHLARLLQSALDRCEERLRSRFRPVLTDALLSVGLQPSNAPERTAFARMVEEMLDRIIEVGFLTFSDLRDTISRNQLKMPDLADPQEFVRGDPLLRLDRRLGTALDGVYRPGEVYLRWLERGTSPAFGTATGRWLTLFVLIPFGGAAVLLQGLHMLLEHFHLVGPAEGGKLSLEGGVVMDYLRLSGRMIPAFDPDSALAYLRGPEPRLAVPGLNAFLLLGIFLLALLHIEWFRRRCKQMLLLGYRGLRWLCIDLPVRVVRTSLVQGVLKSWTFNLFWSFVFKPVVVCALLWELVPDAFATWLAGCSTFLAVNFALNSRMGRAAGEALLQAAADFYELLRAGLLPGLFRLILWVFKRTIDSMEYVLHTVDEWLRFRKGDSQLSLVIRTVAGLFWYPVAFVARFYLVVLVEPGFNPIKAPVSYLAAKFMAPLMVPLTQGLAQLLEQGVGRVLAYVIAVPTVWLLPDMFGFLFWETKENWRMYRANRQRLLRPVSVGPHGETVRQLLRPGFHSGTVPKLYARLRAAEREAIQSGSWRAVRACRRQLAEVAQTISRLVARELVTLLQESAHWRGLPLTVAEVALTPNRIRMALSAGGEVGNLPESAVRLGSPDLPAPRPVWLEWEDQAGWLVATVREGGWLEALDEGQRQAMAAALAGLYKLAGIDLVREQVRANLPAPAIGYDLTADNLVLWVSQRQGPAVLYDLTALKGPLRPRTPAGARAKDWPILEPGRLVFGRLPLSWRHWVNCWQNGQDSKMPQPLFSPNVKLLPVGAVT